MHLNPQLNEFHEKLTLMRGELKTLASQEQSLSEEIKIIEHEIEITALANKVLSSYVEDRLSSFCSQIENTVNEGLKYVFEEDLKIILENTIKRGKAEYKLLISHNGVVGGVGSFGGGVLAIVSFIIRVVLIALSNRIRFIVSDESLAFVSVQYQERLSKFISELCNKMGFYIILITHQPALSTHADRTYVAEMVNGETRFKLAEPERDS